MMTSRYRILVVVLDQESAGWTRLIFVITEGFLDKLVLALKGLHRRRSSVLRTC